MDKDRFDFEQDIFDCCHIIDDLKQLHSMVCENEDTSKDDIANVLGGMFTLYDDRFSQLMDTFEHLINVSHKKRSKMTEKEREELWEEETFDL